MHFVAEVNVRQQFCQRGTGFAGPNCRAHCNLPGTFLYSAGRPHVHAWKGHDSLCALAASSSNRPASCCQTVGQHDCLLLIRGQDSGAAWAIRAAAASGAQWPVGLPLRPQGVGLHGLMGRRRRSASRSAARRVSSR